MHFRKLIIIYFLRPHVLSEDVLQRKILSDGKLYTKRILTKKAYGSLPNWVKKVVSGKQEIIIEESILDTNNKHIDMVSYNVGCMSKILVSV